MSSDWFGATSAYGIDNVENAVNQVQWSFSNTLVSSPITKAMLPLELPQVVGIKAEYWWKVAKCKVVARLRPSTQLACATKTSEIYRFSLAELVASVL